MSRKKVIQEIVARHNARKSLTIESIQTEAKDLYHQACDQFGTWETALLYAGIDVRRIRSIKKAGTKEELKQAIVDLPEDIRMSKVKVILMHHRQVYNAAMEHYGSWCEAVKAAGFDRPKYVMTPTALPATPDSKQPPDVPQTTPPSADSSDQY